MSRLYKCAQDCGSLFGGTCMSSVSRYGAHRKRKFRRTECRDVSESPMQQLLRFYSQASVRWRFEVSLEVLRLFDQPRERALVIVSTKGSCGRQTGEVPCIFPRKLPSMFPQRALVGVLPLSTKLHPVHRTKDAPRTKFLWEFLSCVTISARL